MAHVKGYRQLDIDVKTDPCRDGEDPKQFSNLEVRGGKLEEFGECCTPRSHCNCTNLHSSFLSGEMKTTMYLFEHLLNTCHEAMQGILHA